MSLTRRQALGRLAAAALGLTAAGCTPARIVLHLYPDEFDRDGDPRQATLRAFVLTIVPGADSHDPNLTRALTDPSFPLARYAGFLASDLSRRTTRRHRHGRFDRLSVDDRTALVAAALSEGGTTARLYQGAIYLTQIAVYAGIYDPEHGSPLVGFDGRYRFRGIAATTYPHPERYLPRALTTDGNPA